MIALSRTQGSCTRPGDVPQVWGISQWVGVWGALGLARGNLAVTHLEATYPKLLCRYLGTSCLHCRQTTRRALPVLGQIFAVALLLSSYKQQAPPPVSSRNQQG